MGSGRGASRRTRTQSGGTPASASEALVKATRKALAMADEGTWGLTSTALYRELGLGSAAKKVLETEKTNTSLAGLADHGLQYAQISRTYNSYLDEQRRKGADFLSLVDDVDLDNLESEARDKREELRRALTDFLYSSAQQEMRRAFDELKPVAF